MYKYKRQAINEDLYYKMAQEALQQRVPVKQWLEELIGRELERLERERMKKEEPEYQEDNGR